MMGTRSPVSIADDVFGRDSPQTLLGDRAYDLDAKIRHPLRQRGIRPLIAQRNTEHGSGLATQSECGILLTDITVDSAETARADAGGSSPSRDERAAQP